MRMAVEAMFPGLLLQHPATPVQKATNTKKKETMNRAIIDLAMSVKKTITLVLFFLYIPLK